MEHPRHDIPSGRAGLPPAPPPVARLTNDEFGEKFRSAWRVLWCVAASVTVDRASADDVVQEAAVVALGKLDEFDPATNFTAWMAQIVRFVALNQGRKAARRRGLESADDAAPGRHESRHDALDHRVEAALEGLDETPRACLIMRTVLGMSFKDIAAALGIPEGTAMSHAFRARHAMRDRLLPNADHGAGGTGGAR
ncbi:MAG: sigma-70 family RNA polymerase sigma factor [Phycisphaeraceae bacterium]|nr:MAG: sigma-70 family RNA polymerase sigma factor [Phycisphaeraceae bacterium]